jgi:hypothetical protein
LPIGGAELCIKKVAIKCRVQLLWLFFKLIPCKSGRLINPSTAAVGSNGWRYHTIC